MCNIDSFKIDLKALPQGITEKEFKLTNEYFEAIDAPDVQRGELSSSLSVNRTDDFFELNFHTEGVVQDSFMRKITFQELTRDGLDALAPAITAMAEAEGLDAHANAVRVRMKGGIL